MKNLVKNLLSLLHEYHQNLFGDNDACSRYSAVNARHSELAREAQELGVTPPSPLDHDYISPSFHIRERLLVKETSEKDLSEQQVSSDNYRTFPLLKFEALMKKECYTDDIYRAISKELLTLPRRREIEGRAVTHIDINIYTR